MKIKGFTLIELLAVIVILAIIALIAIPMISKIIDKTEDSAVIRSAELYIDGVNQAIMRANLNNKFRPKECIIQEDGNLICDGEIELKIETTGTKPSEGTLIIEDRRVKSFTGMTLDGYELETNSRGKVIIIGTIDIPEEPTISIIGTAVTEETKTLAGTIPTGEFKSGDEYIINVDGTNEYHFYILGDNNDGTVNLIMDGNICSDGTAATASNLCTVAWDETSRTNGPVKSMEYLAVATSTWKNVPDMKMNYINNSSYGSIITTNKITTITDRSGVVTSTISELKSRLPMVSELTSIGCDTKTNGTCPAYIVNALEGYSGKYTGKKEDISGIIGYWLLERIDNLYAKTVYNLGYVNGYDSTGSEKYGVRPVITLPKSHLS